MDEQVLAALARWPNVPAAYGWLSLSRRGQWLLHPHGQAWGVPDEEPGEPITNPQILAFIKRNYQSDDQGRWFFQNGPQRVYVRLDGAPWILRTSSDTSTAPALLTHTDQPYGPIIRWWLDDGGHLYAQSDQGAGLITDRDLIQVIDALRTDDGQTLSAWLEDNDPPQALDAARLSIRLGDSCPAAPLGRLRAGTAASVLGFVHRPTAPSPGDA